MERYDVSEAERFAEMVSAAEAGVDVEITRDGRVVAALRAKASTVSQPAGRQEALLALRAAAAPLKVGDATLLIREMRDGDRH